MRACTLDGEDRLHVVTVLMATSGSVKELVLVDEQAESMLWEPWTMDKCLGQIHNEGSLSLLKGMFRHSEWVHG